MAPKFPRTLGHEHQAGLILAALLCLAHWFFGNLYEAVVISPNWVEDSVSQVKRLTDFFVNTSPTAYFALVTHVAVALVWLVTWTNEDTRATRHYRRAVGFASAAGLLNTYIVAALIGKIFAAHPPPAEELHAAVVHWNVLNLFRIVLVGAAAANLLRAWRAHVSWTTRFGAGRELRDPSL